MFLIKFNNILIDRKYMKQSKFLDNIKLIYFIHNEKYRNILKLLAYQILKNLTIYNKAYLYQKYLQKFIYIYYKACKYYNINSYYKQSMIQEIATHNLYLITQLDNFDSIYCFSKYLNHQVLK